MADTKVFTEEEVAQVSQLLGLYYVMSVIIDVLAFSAQQGR